MAIMLVSQAGFSLQIGGRYDFFCDHGQDIINAELIDEDDAYYYVKLSVSVNKVPIQKKNVTSTVVKEPPTQMNHRSQPLTFYTLGGAGVATGRFADFSAMAPAAAFYVTRYVFSQTDVVGRSDFLNFVHGNAALRVITFSAGVAFTLPSSFTGFRFVAGGVLGGAYLYAVAEPFREHSLIPTAVIWIGGERHITTSLSIVLSVQALYLYDSEIFVVLPVIMAGLNYRL